MCIIVLLTWAAPVAAQERARVETVAHVRIPDFLILESGAISEEVRPNGLRVRRVIVYVTANRSWSLDVLRVCSDQCTVADYTVSNKSGEAAHARAVIIEFVWGAQERAPAPEEFRFVLAPS